MSKTVFISYARGDDEPFVERLHADLDAHDFDVWWDRVAMSARGRTFLHEIRDAIDSCERFILVVWLVVCTRERYPKENKSKSCTMGRFGSKDKRLGSHDNSDIYRSYSKKWVYDSAKREL